MEPLNVSQSMPGTQYDLRQLVNLPSMAELGQITERLKAKLAELERRGSSADAIDRVRFQLNRSEKDMCNAELRTRLAVELGRPAGCFCLGVGGRYVVYTDLRDGSEPVETFQEVCSCPAGEEEGRRIDGLIGDARARWWRNKTFRTWDESGIPSRFTKMRLDGSPFLKANPKLSSLVSYPVSPVEPANEEQWGEWLERINDWKRSWLLFGPTGTGKTCMSVGYAWQWLHPDFNNAVEDSNGLVSFRSTPDLLTELRDTYNRRRDDESPSEGELIARYADVGLLVLDDLGAEHVRDTGWLEDRLYQIVNRRHGEERTTIFTSNLNPDKLALKIGQRITWRIIEMCGADHVVEVDGRNLRDKA